MKYNALKLYQELEKEKEKTQLKKKEMGFFLDLMIHFHATQVDIISKCK